VGEQRRARPVQPRRCARLDALPGGSDARASGLAHSARHHIAHALCELRLAQLEEPVPLSIDRFGKLPGSLAFEALRFERSNGIDPR
jgi:hypothetical protein